MQMRASIKNLLLSFIGYLENLSRILKNPQKNPKNPNWTTRISKNPPESSRNPIEHERIVKNPWRIFGESLENLGRILGESLENLWGGWGIHWMILDWDGRVLICNTPCYSCKPISCSFACDLHRNRVVGMWRENESIVQRLGYVSGV